MLGKETLVCVWWFGIKDCRQSTHTVIWYRLHKTMFFMENAREREWCHFLNVPVFTILYTVLLRFPRTWNWVSCPGNCPLPVLHKEWDTRAACVLLVITVFRTVAFSSGGQREQQASWEHLLPDPAQTPQRPPSLGVLCQQDWDRLRQSFKRPRPPNPQGSHLFQPHSASRDLKSFSTSVQKDICLSSPPPADLKNCRRL